MKSTAFKVLTGFIMGATVVAGFAIANPFTTPVVKACVDNKTKALFLSSNGSCPKGRSAIDIGATGANVKSIAQLVSPSVVSIKVTAASGSGTGSGSIYKSNSSISYIITNNHVVESAANSGTIKVEFADGSEIAASIVGRDRMYDIAVLQVRKGNLPPIALGDSSKVSVGEEVLAIGSPLGLANTVTQGIISALNRPVTAGTFDSTSYVNAIQTDAAINPGNSGGALIDVAGNLIGVNTAIFSQSGGSLGIGFAIPAKICQQVLNSILKDGRVVRGWLGISLIPNTVEDDVLAAKPIGVIVADVLRDGPADVAGVKRGDKIIQVNNEQITSASHLINYVALQAPQSMINVVVERGGKQQTVQVKVGERKVQQNAQSQYIPLPKHQD